MINGRYLPAIFSPMQSHSSCTCGVLPVQAEAQRQFQAAKDRRSCRMRVGAPAASDSNFCAGVLQWPFQVGAPGKQS